MPIKGIWDRLIPLIFGPFYQSQLVIISPNLSKEAATYLAPLTNNTNKLGWLPLQTVLAPLHSVLAFGLKLDIDCEC